ncbi:MAG TPA: hypothetical protein VF702_01660 [Allosphingosinicella sp.]|jgi:hypothetical protein
MIGLAAFVLMQAAAPQVEPVPPATVQAYYDCAAGRTEALARERARRAVSDIVASAISACAHLRGQALDAALALMLEDPGVREWIRRDNVPDAQARQVGEVEFDRALRRQLLRNVGANPDAEEVRDAQD